MMYGAGDGNRTHATSLEGWNSTIELHPHVGVRTQCFLSTAFILYHGILILSIGFSKFFYFLDVLLTDVRNHAIMLQRQSVTFRFTDMQTKQGV